MSLIAPWLSGLTLPGALASSPAVSVPPLRPLGSDLPMWTVLPFVILLLAIALAPLVAGHWWERNRNKAMVVVLLSLPTAAALLRLHGDAAAHLLVETGLDYLSFLSLLGALFVISGGILVEGAIGGSPLGNTAILAIGAILSNLVGTTGASVILIRPLLRANRHRHSRAHLVVFFIFVVSNCSGLLTPLGDPPLFLAFLKGVPFTWTLCLWKPWLLVNGALLAIFHACDEAMLGRDATIAGRFPPAPPPSGPIRVLGLGNGLLLAAIMAIVVAKGNGIGNEGRPWPFGPAEIAMVGLACLGYRRTSPQILEANRFGFGPIVEVAVLFAGIFVTMVPPLQILNARGAELALSAPWQYFWAAGLLSSFLDNAPTYLTFSAAACGKFGVAMDGPRYLADFLARGPEAARILAAISCGAVFMGANTYIGNGPNFMVKAIAEEGGVIMPSFFEYMAWSTCVLLPLFGLATCYFFV